MRQVQLDEILFDAVTRQAIDAGYVNVDEYVARVLQFNLAEDDGGGTPNLDHLFTNERLARIDAAAAQIANGQVYTREQSNIELAKRRAEWLQNNSR